MTLTQREQKILNILGVDLDLFLDNKAKVKSVERAFAKYSEVVLIPKSRAIPAISVGNNSSIVEHEARVGKVSQTQLEYIQSRGLTENQAVALIITKSFSEILSSLPLEFAIEAKKLIEANLGF